MKGAARANPWSPENWTVSEQQQNSALPKVTIGILSYNRKDDLRRTLDCITKAMQYPNLEVIVVDNNSKDGSVEMVRCEFPTVLVIALDENLAVSARNLFYARATGKYVFSYDDDSFPATPSSFYRIVEFLERTPSCDALSFFCYQPNTGFAESGNARMFRFSGTEENGYDGLYFVEGGMCVRASSWKIIKGYDPDFVWGAEGADLTLQMYRRGMRIMFHSGFATLHMKSSRNRDLKRNSYFFTRNYLWTIAKHFPLFASVPLAMLYVVRRLVGIILYPRLSAPYLKGIYDGIRGSFLQSKKCDKLNFIQILRLKRWYFFLFRW